MVCCNSCGGSNPKDSAFCNKCGEPISVPLTKQQSAPKLLKDQSIVVPPYLHGVIILRPKEFIVRLWAGFRHTFVLIDGHENPNIESGYLMVTNQRVFFIKKSGLINKSYAAVDVVALENIGGITVKPGFINDLLIINHGQGGFVGTLSVSRIAEMDLATSKQGQSVNIQNFHQLLDQSVSLQIVDQLLSELVQQRLHEIDEEKRKERVQYVLDFSFLKSEMEKGGVIVQTIKCPACSAGISFPSAGTTIQCPYCGSMVYAQDVFEKMKGLISSI